MLQFNLFFTEPKILIITILISLFVKFPQGSNIRFINFSIKLYINLIRDSNFLECFINL